MSDLTDYAETEIRDWMSQGVDPDTSPSSVYVALHTSAPSESTPGGTELDTSSYARVEVTAGSGWDTPDNASFENANVVSFPTANSDWGEVTHVSLWDSATGGNCLAAYPMDASVTIQTNDTLEFPAGNISFAID